MIPALETGFAQPAPAYSSAPPPISPFPETGNDKYLESDTYSEKTGNLVKRKRVDDLTATTG
jgi:hypothetical protein